MYQALYRKWRPRAFDDVISQPSVRDALLHQIADGRTGHAYLFTGSRGTGKTTCARILAKAVNCLQPTPEGNPCLECEICRDAERGALGDIVEIDAASNNSVEDVRDLREGTVYLPERCRYKVYIIDEVHMLSPSAWGALLKVMEEPPEYVKFILATTEVHKVPATIVSRCQCYPFRRIRSADIAARLLSIAEKEDFTLEADAAALIAHLSDGGMRDALSLLDQCASVDDTVTVDSVVQIAGVAGRDATLDIVEAVLENDAPKVMEAVGSLYDQAKDMTRLCDEITEHMRNLMLIRAGLGAQQDLFTCLPDEMARLDAMAENVSLETIFSDLSALQDCRERMHNVQGKRTELEMTLLQLTMPTVRLMPPPTVSAPVPPPSSPASPSPAPVPQVNSSPSPTEARHPVAQWADICAQCETISPAMTGILRNSAAYIAGERFIVEVSNQFSLDLLMKNREDATKLKEVINTFLGHTYKFTVIVSKDKVEKGSKVQTLVDRAKQSGIESDIEA